MTSISYTSKFNSFFVHHSTGAMKNFTYYSIFNREWRTINLNKYKNEGVELTRKL